MTLRLSLRDLYAAAFTAGLEAKPFETAQTLSHADAATLKRGYGRGQAQRPRERLCASCGGPVPATATDGLCSPACADYFDSWAW